MPSLPEGASCDDEGHAGKHARKDLTGLRIVVDDQDAAAAQIGPGACRLPSRRPFPGGR